MKHPRMSHIQADDLLNHSVPREFQHPIRPCRGVALVIVLAVIVLVLGLVVAFMNLAKTERRSAATYLANTEVRQLADTAVGIVQAQINHATSQGSNTAWISQPGMVRTYNSSGGLQTAYKLYSAESLTETSAGALGSDVPGSDWDKQPAHWVDLNSPVKTADKSIYPIIDPDVFDLPNDVRPLAIEPITGAPVGTVAPANPAPMPVRWLYVLQDGKVVAPTTGGNGTTANIAGADADNPVVGRIAFWTDDESCKVNINTAGAGSFWDQPRFTNQNERDFAKKQPLNGEFQRYPGHPAMTSLRAVFPAMTDEDILSILTPRYQWGGSLQGTVDTFKLTTALAGGNVADFPLYASVDELFFRPSFTLNGTSSTSNGTSEKTRMDNSSLSADQINTARFFLTHASRAPEINLFNLPRVSIWPIASSTSSRTTFDEVIAFASTIGGKPYYFERQSSMSPTADAEIMRNKQIYSYLQNLTGKTVPGFGVTMSGKFGSDRDQILTQVWDYIRSTNLYDSRLASGKQFTANTGEDGYGYVVPLEVGSTRGFGRAITLSELAFAFLCSADPVDIENTPPDPLGLKQSNDPTKNTTLGGVALDPNQRRIQMAIIPELFTPMHGNIFIRAKNTRIRISGLNTLEINGQKLFSKNEDTIDFKNLGGGHHNRALGGPFDSRSLYREKSTAFVSNFVTVTVPNPGTSSPGTMEFSGSLTVKIELTDGTVLQTIPINLPSGPIPIPNLVTTGTINKEGADPNSTSGDIPFSDEKYWWAFSQTRPWTEGASQAPFTYDNNRTRARLSYIEKSPGSWSVNSASKVPIENSTSIGAGVLFRGSLSSTTYTDVVRSMVPWHGDYRLVAALKDVPSDTFTELGTWSATGPANALIHNLASGVNYAEHIPGGKQWRRHYVTADRIGGSTAQGDGGRFSPDFRRDASTGLINQLKSTGDFDNGFSFWPDGAFINKPDEGNVVVGKSEIPYFKNSEQEKMNSEAFFSPNRMVVGPGMFGSLPSHVQRHKSNSSSVDNVWRTLLFRNQPDHPNAVSLDAGGRPSGGFAPDHLLMDLFWMPVVEPYAISEPFSTAGKVNMNYQIEPFRYIKRGTAMAAVLAAEKITAVSSGENLVYKNSEDATLNLSNQYRFLINISETLKQFQTRFENTTGRLFVSPTELCDLWLVPEGSSLSSMSSFWSNYNLTGDNMRERPYTTIIPRLTTKSNTFTVHFRVQSLKNPPANPGVWEEGKGTVTGDYRGSTTIERFINLEDPTLANTDFATDPSGPTLDEFYRWRTIQTSQFAP